MEIEKQAFAFIHGIKLSGTEVVDVLRSYLEKGWVYLDQLQTYDGLILIFERDDNERNAITTNERDAEQQVELLVHTITDY